MFMPKNTPTSPSTIRMNSDCKDEIRASRVDEVLENTRQSST